MRVLVAMRDSDKLDSIKEALVAQKYQVDIAQSIADAQYMLDVRTYSLILIHSNLAEKGALLEFISLHKNIDAVQMFLDAKASEKTELEVFKAGGGDYLKEGSEAILIARIKARLKFAPSGEIAIGDLKLYPLEERVVFKDKVIELRGKPFEVLVHLAKNNRQIISKEQLLNAIWEEPELVTPNVIEVAINQIRQKLDLAIGSSSVETVRRRGYRFKYS